MLQKTPKKPMALNFISFYLEPTSPRNSLSLGSSSLELPPSRSSLFNAFGRSGSSQSLPNDASKNSSMAPQLPPLRIGEPVPKRPPALTTQTLPVPKTPEMRTSSTIKVFNRGSKPTKMSEAPRLDLNIPSSSTQDTLDSFSLKSFRPVRPISPAPPNALGMDLSPGANNPSISPSGLFPPSPIPASSRSRGASVGSENSPKITVAQFRQAQMESAKNRSSVHLPVPEHPSDGMPPGNVPLHVNLARPVSPAFSQGKGGNASGNESGGDNGTPSRPARLLPPQTLGRSSPVPRAHTPVTSSPIARSPMSQTPRDGPRTSANWMLADSDSDSSEDTASGEAAPRQAGRPARKPPLIPDFQNMKSPLPPQTETTTSPYPSSFASASRSKTALSASQSDLGHSSSSTTRPQQAPQPNSSPRLEATPNRSALTPPSPQNIRPGEYSAGGSPSARSPQTVESVDTWSNTHSQVHSRQGSHDRIQNYRGTTKSEIGHGE
ncbi:hypothetical protein CPB86DRAFT_528153 [Serendipita vermifera]|nr:hypothetical protein CPB86DRAFT_528153 [Serendipita vermifera]